MGFLYRRRYALPPTDERWLDSTVADVVLDYYAHLVTDNPKLREEFVNPDFDDDMAELEARAEADAAEAEAADPELAARRAAARERDLAAEAEAARVAAQLNAEAAGGEWEVEERRWS